MTGTVTRDSWRNGPGGPVARIGAVTLAAAMHLVVLVPFTVASGLLAPLWAVAALYVLWVVAALALVWTVRRNPFAALLVPVVNAGLLWLAITAGESLLGWTG